MVYAITVPSQQSTDNKSNIAWPMWEKIVLCDGDVAIVFTHSMISTASSYSSPITVLSLLTGRKPDRPPSRSPLLLEYQHSRESTPLADGPGVWAPDPRDPTPFLCFNGSLVIADIL